MTNKRLIIAFLLMLACVVVVTAKSKAEKQAEADVGTPL